MGDFKTISEIEILELARIQLYSEIVHLENELFEVTDGDGILPNLIEMKEIQRNEISIRIQDIKRTKCLTQRSIKIREE